MDSLASTHSMIGESEPMKQIFDVIRLVGPSCANVLIQGESGSGKELVAKAIHSNGPRRSKPFIPINCAAIPEQLLESELFGYAKGSFTGAAGTKRGLFEEADGGTLFLDEIGDMSLDLQAKLLRVIQDRTIRSVGSNQFKKIDVRILAATHRDLCRISKTGLFREDLYYRLSVIPIRVPPLRERKEDISNLVRYFLHKFSRQNSLSVQDISADAMEVLNTHHWPGNVRELENVLERALVLSHGKTITLDKIQFDKEEPSSQLLDNLQNQRPTLQQLEEHYIKMIITQVQHKKEEAAHILGISRRTLYRKEKLYGLSPTDK